jgi:hypothetical protein
MRLSKNGLKLFPNRLTKSWIKTIDGSTKSYTEFRSQITEALGCPWNTAPKNIDEFIEVCDARAKWEKENNASAPLNWSCIISHSLFEDMAREVKELRNAKRNT